MVVSELVPSRPDVEPADVVPLASLRNGARGLVARVDREDAVTTRLMDLGLTPGTEVQVLRRAPLGDPVLYELRGVQLALRRGEARRVLVHPLPAGDDSAPRE